MGIVDKVRVWLSRKQGKAFSDGQPAVQANPAEGPPTSDLEPAPTTAQQPASEKRFDNVKIVNVLDGTTIQGHDAVKAYYAKEDQLLREHGSSIIFMVYRINLEAESIGELNGNLLVELKVNEGFASGTDTVATAKAKLRSLLLETRPDIIVGSDDRLTFSFGNREMRDEKLFFADHYMLLPAWVQVYIHACESETVYRLARHLTRKTSGNIDHQ